MSRRVARRVRGARSSGREAAVFIRLLAGVALVGWFFSRRMIVQVFNMVPPFYVLIVQYMAMYLFIYAVFRDLPFMGRRFGALDALGATMLTFALLLVWSIVESPWAAIASGRSPEGIPNILFASEDGVTWLFWQAVIERSGMSFPAGCLLGYCLWPNWYDLVKDLTYIVTPVIMVLAAAAILGLRGVAREARRAL